MDPFNSALSAYELEYTKDIQRTMRIPEKISLDSEKPLAVVAEGTLPITEYPVADLVLDSTQRGLNSPGYSPDILDNTDVRPSSFSSATAHASAKADSQTHGLRASASAEAQAITSNNPPKVPPVEGQQLIASAPSVQLLEFELTRLRSRVTSLESRQTVIETCLTIYVVYRLLRWFLQTSD
ncbi:unnamed protein product [Calicophoron daubneyi]|uniref:Mitochondrial fission factor n=1 Tax=Calicophoron daubneyi TaxID=300641 RepID=A0AAV2T9X7_CALDB